jgi:hypothetical protein
MEGPVPSFLEICRRFKSRVSAAERRQTAPTFPSLLRLHHTLKKWEQICEGAAAILFDFKRDIASSVSWKGGRFAHQRPHSVMDNADNTAVGYLNNAPVSHLAFILLSVGCSVFVAGSDIGPKVLDIMLGH